MNEDSMTVTEETQEQFLKEGEKDKRAKRGVKLIRKEKYDDAIKELVKASEKHPDNWYIWYHLGMVYRHLVLMDEALGAFQKAAALDNVSTFYQNAATIRAAMVSLVLQRGTDALQLADYLVKCEEYTYCLRALDIAERNKPDNPNVMQIRAHCLLQLERFDEAQSIYERIIQIHPETHFPYVALGTLLFSQGRTEEALGLLEKSTEIKPDDAKGWIYYGDRLLQVRRYDEALEKFQKSLEIDQSPMAYFYMARALYALGQTRKAILALDEAIAYDRSILNRVLSSAEFMGLQHDSDFRELLRKYSS
ncbi:MAG: tetratricopeptide repeat protein [Candidatus Thorarchaeota archaeon]